jgi:N-acetylmuramoyl-L-alanine amidase
VLHLEDWAAVAAALVAIIVLTTTNRAPPMRRPPSQIKNNGVAAVAPTSPYAIDSGGFSPGACIAFPPTAADRHETVFLDAGHGGIDPGGTGTTQAGQTIYEADETLPVELDAMMVLRDQGFRVVVSRTGATSVARLGPDDLSDGVFSAQGAHDEVAARDLCANEANANVLVGIYYDAGGSPEYAGCVTAFDADRPFAGNNFLLASLVQQNELMAMNAQGWAIPDEGVKPDTTLGSSASEQDVAYGHLLLLGPAKTGYFSGPSQMPGTILEPLFITDPAEGSIAATAEGQQVIAGALAEAIEQYLGSPAAEQVPTG